MRIGGSPYPGLLLFTHLEADCYTSHMDPAPRGLQMVVPADAVGSVLFCVSTLFQNRITLIPWAAYALEDGDEESTILLTPEEDTILLGGYALLGHAVRPGGGHIEIIRAPHLSTDTALPSITEWECSICLTKRHKYHFLLAKDEEFIFAGHSCLVKTDLLHASNNFNAFFPASILDPREYLQQIIDRVMSRPSFDTLECLAAAIHEHRLNGYVSRQRADARNRPSTASAVSYLMERRVSEDTIPVEISENLLAAAVLRNELSNIDAGQLTDFARKAIAVTTRERIRSTSLGLLAAVPMIYANSISPATPAVDNLDSRWVGECGDRREWEVRFAGLVDIEREFLPTLRKATFHTLDGDILVWFTQAEIPQRVGESIKLRGTIKRHTTFRDVKETVLSRCILSS